ncbi:MAG: hypothetical protein ACYDAS_00345 [Patescibacteria group bacterium]
MDKYTKHIGILKVFPFAVLSLALATSVYAASHNSNAQSTTGNPNVATTRTTTTNNNASQNSAVSGTNGVNGKTVGQNAKASGLAKSCKARIAAITERSDHMVALAAVQEKAFTRIALSVESYYSTKVTTKNITVPNYQILVNNVQSAEDAVLAAKTKVSGDAANLTCTTTSPQTMVLAFNTDMKAEILALRLYRKSIVNLIVAVRSSLSTTKN